MKFPPSFLDDIRQRVTASSVVGRRVAWDRRKSNFGRGDYWACCPFHTEKSPSFHVDDRKGRYHCFGCKASGDIFTFLVEKEGVSFPEAVERLAQEAGLAMPQMSEEAQQREAVRSSLYEVMEFASAFFEAELHTARGARARSYLADRGLDGAIQKAFRIGFAPDDKSALRNNLTAKAVSLEQMVEAGLVIPADETKPVAFDRFRDRIMFPIRDGRGRVIAFGGRALSKEAQAKYLNSPETPLFHKGHVLYNIDKARGPAHETQEIVAVEGYMDAIAMHRAGIPQVVAPLGTALTEDQLALLWRMAPEPTLCFDGDAAGQKAAWRALDIALPLLKPGHSLRFVLLPEGQDPDDLLKSDGPEAVKAAVAAARPLSDMLWAREAEQARIDTPDGRAMLEVKLNGLIAGIGDDTVRKYYREDFARRLGQHLSPKQAARNFPARGRQRAYVQPRPQLSARRGPRERPASYDYPGPPSEGLRASSLVSGGRRADHERREKLMLFAIVNHPELLHEFLDELSELEFSGRELDSLRRELIDIAALSDGLDGAAVKDHLTLRGFGPVLARLELQAVRLSEWFLKSDAASADARTGLGQLIALHRKSGVLDRELTAAEAAFAADPTEEKLDALNQIRDDLSSPQGSEARIEGFGAASGRSEDAVS
ncbi:DNA primase [soil metagenome]